MRKTLAPQIRNLDVVTLMHIADAEQKGEPTPPAFLDTLMRLLKRGYLRGDRARRVRVTAAGVNFLRKAS